MKKFSFLSALLMLLGLSATAQEQITVDELEIVPGHEAYMAVRFQFNEDHEYVSYQFTVDLPEGISLIAESEKADLILADNQPAALFSTDFPVSNGILKVFSNPSTRIAGSSGLLVLIPVIADESLAVGTTLTGQLKDMEFTKNTGSVRTVFANTPISIKVTNKIVLDENCIAEPFVTDDDVDLLVKRTIKAGEWSTICLPFDMGEEQVKQIFGNDVRLADFSTYDTQKEGGKVVGLTVNFVDVDVSEGLYGNWPYLIKTSKDITEFATTATVVPDDVLAEYDNGKTGRQRKVFGKFIGTYEANTVVPENSLFLSGNKFYYSTGKTKMKAFRAYFTLNDVLADMGNASARISMSFNDEATAISDATRLSDNGAYYSLDGRKLDKRPVRKGVYIRNGKKNVIK